MNTKTELMRTLNLSEKDASNIGDFFLTFAYKEDYLNFINSSATTTKTQRLTHDNY